MTRAIIQEITDGPDCGIAHLTDEVKDKAHHLVERMGDVVSAAAVTLAHGVEHMVEDVRTHTRHRPSSAIVGGSSAITTRRIFRCQEPVSGTSWVGFAENSPKRSRGDD